MKTDVVLTMDEYLDECCVVPQKVSPPARDARRIPIAANEHVDLSQQENSNCCDRWGHPCPNSIEHKPQSLP